VGIDFYFKKNYVAASHILIPCIEDTIREFLEKLGGNIFKGTKEGGIQLHTFYDVLRNEKLSQVLGKDMLFYFKVLLVDPRGWNLRNDICHGFYESGIFNYATADRLIHVLLCLALVKKNDNNNNHKNATE